MKGRETEGRGNIRDIVTFHKIGGSVRSVVGGGRDGSGRARCYELVHSLDVMYDHEYVARKYEDESEERESSDDVETYENDPA